MIINTTKMNNIIDKNKITDYNYYSGYCKNNFSNILNKEFFKIIGLAKKENLKDYQNRVFFKYYV